jgi:hypothetical protein
MAIPADAQKRRYPSLPLSKTAEHQLTITAFRVRKDRCARGGIPFADRSPPCRQAVMLFPKPVMLFQAVRMESGAPAELDGTRRCRAV